MSMSGAALGMQTPQREGAVRRELSRLERSINELCESVKTLQLRLSWVAHPATAAPPPIQPSNKALESINCELSVMISNEVTRLQDLRLEVEGLSASLEI